MCEGCQSRCLLFIICYKRNNHVSLDIFSVHIMDQVITLSIIGALNTVLSEEHKKEMRRYLYNHQVRIILLQCYEYSLSCLFPILHIVHFLVIFSSFLESCSLVKHFLNVEICTCRTKMVGGDYTLRAQVPCLVPS
jgi:hypothetical protein